MEAGEPKMLKSLSKSRHKSRCHTSTHLYRAFKKAGSQQQNEKRENREKNSSLLQSKVKQMIRCSHSIRYSDIIKRSRHVSVPSRCRQKKKPTYFSKELLHKFFQKQCLNSGIPTLTSQTHTSQVHFISMVLLQNRLQVLLI